VLVMTLTGCHGIGYYSQAIRGHFYIVNRTRPIEEVLADPNSPAAVKEKLQLVLSLRTFAEKELTLPANGHYLRYADIGRRFAVWNVYAAPEFSLEAKTWWYPIVGGLKYQGYFAEDKARRYAANLEKNGYDVYVGGVQAYSTLGWFRDPVLNTFIQDSEVELADLLFHELAHQRLFVAGDTDFNEAFATAVAEEGVRRWLTASNNRSVLEEYEIELRRKEQFVALVSKARADLESLYAKAPFIPVTGPDKGGQRLATEFGPRKRPEARKSDTMRAAKQRIIEQLRLDYPQLKARWGGYDGYDGWFQLPINNAQLNDVDTYYTLVPAFLRILKANGGDLEKFYKEVATLAKLSKTERHRRLNALQTAQE
jgi:predicted aminopeptidase